MSDSSWLPWNWFGSSGSSSMPSVGTETLTPQWQGYEAGALGQAKPSDASQAFSTGYTAGQQPWSAPTTGNAPSFGDWLMSKEGAKALQDTGNALKDPQSNQAPRGSQLTPASMGSGSQVVRGNTQTLSQLMQMLSNRRYSPIGYSGGGSSTRGLLGY